MILTSDLRRDRPSPSIINTTNNSNNMAEGYPTVAFLEIDGKVLSGEEFEEYCKDHGLCRRCARVKTHRRVVKMFGRGRKWEPMTLHDDLTGEYTVYKGYCLQPNCYTLGQAKRLLGESAGSRTSRRQTLTDRFKRDGASARRPNRRKTRANPETGSVMSAMPDDDMSLASDMSGASNRSGTSAISGMSGMSGFSGLGGALRRRRRSNKRSSSGASSASSVSSMDMSDDDDMTVDTTMTKDVNPSVEEGEVNPIVAHRAEQLALYDYFTVLDLSKVALRPEDIAAVVAALGKAQTLENVTLDKCKLRDDGVDKIMQGIKAGNHMNLKKLSLRQNSMGNKGAESLVFLLQKSTTLEELDLSENAISSRGASVVFDALNSNRETRLHTLNLSQNEIWDMDDGSYLSTNKTLKVLNLDGNFLHDEGAEHIAHSITENKNAVLEKLFLGWNGIADDGATALAKMMEANSTLQVLGLAENDITNTGARAILSSLAVNTSVREISGLYHNQIDRKFIIVAIKRLLHRFGDRTGEVPTVDESRHFTPEDQKSHHDDESDASTNWASRLYSDQDKEPASPQKRPSVALEAIEKWDWGTFGIDEIEKSTRDSFVAEPMADLTDDDEVVEAPQQDSQESGNKISRISVFRSAPLAYFNRQTSEHHDVPLLDLDYEKTALTVFFKDKALIGGADIEVVHEVATQDRLKDFFARGTSPVLHLSGHGHPDCLALENGFGYMHACNQDELKNCIMLNQGLTKLVVVSAVHAKYTAKLFLGAGIKHVVCCEREAVFRDEGAVEFLRALYTSLAKNKTIFDAFHDGVEAVKQYPTTTSVTKASDRFQLLPKQSSTSDYHKVKVFFPDQGNTLPKVPSRPPTGDTTMLPPLPSHFVGREVDMYEVLESLRVDDVVRVGGTAGSGKCTLLAAVAHYVLARPESFGINAVYWLPPPPEVYPEEDTCYGDLAQVMDLLVEAEDDIWDEDLYAECRERIMIELADQRSILVIDGRIFNTEAAGENLERFLSHLLNEVSVKIILLTAHEGSARTKRSRSEETMITMGPLSFKASALLFGNSCPHVCPKGSTIARTAEEFADILVPPSLKNQGADQTKDLSRRQTELYDRMGKGNPKEVIEAAKAISKQGFLEMLRLARRPEVQVTSAEVLKAELAKRNAQKEKAILTKNFLRAQDLSYTLDELEQLKSKYPSLDDLGSQEAELKKEFSELLKARKYDEANKVKRKILNLKKDMMKEKYSKKPAGGTTAGAAASDKLQKLQAKMDALTLQANQTQVSESDRADVTFVIPRGGEGKVLLHISDGEVVNYRHSGGMCGIICWSNECCDFSAFPWGQELLKAGADNLKEDIECIDILVDTEWGPTKIATGEAEIVGPRSYSKLSARYVVLAVPPLSPSNDDEEFDADFVDQDTLHYLETTLRTAYRSSFQMVKNTGMEGVGIAPATTKPGGKVYERTLKIGLQTLIDEAKTTRLQSIHLMAATEKEAKILIKLASACGLEEAKA